MINNETIIKTTEVSQEFETGAHRNDAAGKGDCTLLPLGVASILLDDDPVLECIDLFENSGDIDYLISALRESTQTIPQFQYSEILKDLESHGIPLSPLEKSCEYWARMIPCICTMLLEVSIHFEDGAKIFGRHNWKNGMPLSRYLNSAVRHYLKTLRGDLDEPHYRAFAWNVLCAIWTAVHKPELNDFKEESKKSAANKEV